MFRDKRPNAADLYLFEVPPDAFSLISVCVKRTVLNTRDYASTVRTSTLLFAAFLGACSWRHSRRFQERRTVHSRLTTFGQP